MNHYLPNKFVDGKFLRLQTAKSARGMGFCSDRQEARVWRGSRGTDTDLQWWIESDPA